MPKLFLQNFQSSTTKCKAPSVSWYDMWYMWYTTELSDRSFELFVKFCKSNLIVYWRNWFFRYTNYFSICNLKYLPHFLPHAFTKSWAHMAFCSCFLLYCYWHIFFCVLYNLVVWADCCLVKYWINVDLTTVQNSIISTNTWTISNTVAHFKENWMYNTLF